MNFVHTLWTKPLLNSNKSDKEIIDSIRTTLLDYTLSMRLVQAFGHTITLYTDTNGFEILKPLPYDNVVIVKIPEDEDIRFAAQIKFKALQLGNLDDFIIDGDILLQKEDIYDKLENLIKTNDCLYSVVENIGQIDSIHPGYKKMIDTINNSNILNGYKYTDNKVSYPNTSILFIQNPDLRKSYIDQYNYHRSILQGKDFGGIWPDIWIEQYFLQKTLDLNKEYKHRPVIYNFEVSNEPSVIGFTHLATLKKKVNLAIAAKLFVLDQKLFNMINQHMEYLSKKYVH